MWSFGKTNLPGTPMGKGSMQIDYLIVKLFMQKSKRHCALSGVGGEHWSGGSIVGPGLGPDGSAWGGAASPASLSCNTHMLVRIQMVPRAFRTCKMVPTAIFGKAFNVCFKNDSDKRKAAQSFRGCSGVVWKTHTLYVGSVKFHIRTENKVFSLWKLTTSQFSVSVNTEKV